VGEPVNFPEAAALTAKLRNEYVVEIRGHLRERKDPNPNLPTGNVELVAESVQILNAVTKLLPFPISEREEQEPPREELRLKNRVLDLRCACCCSQDVERAAKYTRGSLRSVRQCIMIGATGWKLKVAHI
jgi:aspartyl-tRNA synthetase